MAQPTDDDKDAVTRAVEAQASMMAKADAAEARSNRPPDIGQAPQSQMASTQTMEHTDATKVEMEAGKRAADDWQKRRDAEKEVGARLANRVGPARPSMLPTRVT